MSGSVSHPTTRSEYVPAQLGPSAGFVGVIVAAHGSVELEGDLRTLPADVASTAHRIAAEALTNVARHSGATSCWVRVGRIPEGLALSIRDNGRGLPEGATVGLGLASMRRRAAVLGGHVTVLPVDPTGRILAFHSGTLGDDPFPDLTPREREVLGELAGGARNHEIAARLGLSQKTVRNHVSGILLKLQVPDRTAAAIKAKDAGITPPR